MPKVFHCKAFDIVQNEEVFALGTDSFLLGSYCQFNNAQNILDIGCGTGILSLMCAQRFPTSKIHSIDIDPNATALASHNFQQSPFSEGMTAETCALQDFFSKQSFDGIITNPPYFETNASAKHILARQRQTLDFGDLGKHGSRLLSERGSLWMILPQEVSAEVIKIFASHHLYLQEELGIRGKTGKEVNRKILHFKKTMLLEIKKSEFCVRNSDGNYTEAYLDLTKDFHLMSK